MKFIKTGEKDEAYYPKIVFFVQGFKGVDLGDIVKNRKRHRWEVDDLYMYSDCLRKLADKLDELDKT